VTAPTPTPLPRGPRPGCKRRRDGVARRPLTLHLPCSLLAHAEDIAALRGVSLATVVEDALAYGLAGFYVETALVHALQAVPGPPPP
jgi:hypothetical protein